MKLNVNEDLKKERLKCTFNTEELTNFLDGGADKTLNRRNLGLWLINLKKKYSINMLIF